MPRARPHPNVLPRVAVDTVVLSFSKRGFQTYLAQPRAGAVKGKWACPGGLVASGETLDEAAQRELAAAGLKPGTYIEQLFTFGNPTRDPGAHVVAVAYLALIANPDEAARPAEKYVQARWFRVAATPTLAYDHAMMVRLGIARVQAKLSYTNLACNLLPEVFTFSELEALYRGVLGRRLDRRNFRRRIMAMGILRPVPGLRHGSHRPAQLYRFRKRAPQIVEIL